MPEPTTKEVTLRFRVESGHEGHDSIQNQTTDVYTHLPEDGEKLLGVLWFKNPRGGEGLRLVGWDHSDEARTERTVRQLRGALHEAADRVRPAPRRPMAKVGAVDGVRATSSKDPTR